MNAAQLVQALGAHDPSMTADIYVDVGGDVRELSHISTLVDGRSIIVLVPKDT